MNPVKYPHGGVTISPLGASLVYLGLGEVSGAYVGVDQSDFAGVDGESPADTLDNSEGEANRILSVDVSVHHTKEVLKLAGACQDKALKQSASVNSITQTKAYKGID